MKKGISTIDKKFFGESDSAFFEALLNDMVTFVAVLDKSGTILFVNNTPLKSVGVSLAELQGKKFWDAAWWEYEAEAIERIRQDCQACANGRPALHDIKLKTADGSLVWIEYSMHPIYGEEGEVKYLVPEGRVIEDRKRAEHQMLQMNEALKSTNEALENKAQELEKTSKYKSEFLANMSHELRTPLNSLLILSGLLIENDEANLSEDEVDSAKVIYESGKHLLALINDILDISKIEAGQSLVSNEEISIDELIEMMNKRFVHMAADKNISFDIEMNSRVPKVMISDKTKLFGILTNLVSNALKFTAKGGVRLTLNADENNIFFKVIDTGIGISTDKLESIFEAFKQADGTTTRNYGGTGLGLSIARSFASLLDGDISVDSEINKGSTFTLEMPLGKEKKISIEHIVQHASLKICAAPFDDDRENLSEEKKTFLIIEDDIKYAKILYNTCREKEHQALVSIDGESGLALIKKYKIDGVILDYMLPGHDGGDILSVLKKDMDTNHIPVYIISVLDSLGDMKSFGALGQMQKPLQEKDIVNILHELDNASQTQDALSMENSKTVLANKKVLIVDDDMRNTYSLSKLLSNKKMKIEIASSGKRALKMLDEIDDFDIILMDIMMPEMDGYEVMKRLRKHSKYAKVPVLALTANAMQGDQEKCLEAGANDYVSKPVDIGALFTAMESQFYN